MSLAIVGYLGHELVIYDVIPTIFSFYAALGLAAGLLMRLDGAEEKPAALSTWKCRAAVGFTAVLALWVGVHMVRHAYTDTVLTELQRHAATLRGYQKYAHELAQQQRQVENLKKNLLSEPDSKDAQKLRSVLADAGVDVRRMPADDEAARTWAQDALTRMLRTVQEKERLLDAKMGSEVRFAARQAVRLLKVMLSWNAPAENLYNAAHAAAVLAHLPEATLAPASRL